MSASRCCIGGASHLWMGEKDSKQDGARHREGEGETEKQDNTKQTNKKEIKKNKVCFINESLLIGKIQSFLASHALRNLALR